MEGKGIELTYKANPSRSLQDDATPTPLLLGRQLLDHLLHHNLPLLRRHNELRYHLRQSSPVTCLVQESSRRVLDEASIGRPRDGAEVQSRYELLEVIGVEVISHR